MKTKLPTFSPLVLAIRATSPSTVVHRVLAVSEPAQLLTGAICLGTVLCSTPLQAATLSCRYEDLSNCQNSDPAHIAVEDYGPTHKRFSTSGSLEELNLSVSMPTPKSYELGNAEPSRLDISLAGSSGTSTQKVTVESSRYDDLNPYPASRKMTLDINAPSGMNEVDLHGLKLKRADVVLGSGNDFIGLRGVHMDRYQDPAHVESHVFDLGDGDNHLKSYRSSTWRQFLNDPANIWWHTAIPVIKIGTGHDTITLDDSSQFDRLDDTGGPLTLAIKNKSFLGTLSQRLPNGQLASGTLDLTLDNYAKLDIATLGTLQGDSHITIDNTSEVRLLDIFYNQDDLTIDIDHGSALDTYIQHFGFTHINLHRGAGLLKYQSQGWGGLYLESDSETGGDVLFTTIGSLQLNKNNDTIVETNTLHHIRPTLDLGEGKNRYEITLTEPLTSKLFRGAFFDTVLGGNASDNIDTVSIHGGNYDPTLVRNALANDTLPGTWTFDLKGGTNVLTMDGGLYVVKSRDPDPTPPLLKPQPRLSEGVKMGAGNNTFSMTGGTFYTEGLTMAGTQNRFSQRGGHLIIADQGAHPGEGLVFNQGELFEVRGDGATRPVLDVHRARFSGKGVNVLFSASDIVNTTADTPATLTWDKGDDTLTIANGASIHLESAPYDASANQPSETESGVLNMGEGQNRVTIKDNSEVVATIESAEGDDWLAIYTSTLKTPTGQGTVASLGAGNDNVVMEKSTLLGDIHTGDGVDSVALNDSNVTGLIDLGDGDDILTVEGKTVFGPGTTLSGGKAIDRLYLNRSLTAARSASAEQNIIGINEFESIEIAGLDNTLTWVDTQADGDILVKDDSTFTLAAQTTATVDYDINGSVINAGHIRLDANHMPGDKLIVHAEYEGLPGSNLWLNASWNDSDATDGHFESDSIVIEGSALGRTTVHAISSQGEADVIDGDMTKRKYSIRSTPVVQVLNPKAENGIIFTGTAKSAGIADYQLLRLTEEGKDNYVWTATALDGFDEPRPDAKKDDAGVLILSPAVAGYAATPNVNLTAGFSALSNYRERWGQVEGFEETPERSHRAYVRLLGAHQNTKGNERLNTKTNTTGVEIATSLRNRKVGDVLSQTAALLGYRSDESDIADRLRTENGMVVGERQVSEATSQQYTLGLSHTFRFLSGNFLDLVVQASRLQNRYKAVDGLKATQRGWSARVSAEIGSPINVFENDRGTLRIEPQMQLAYQRLWLDDFSDGIHDVNTYLRHSAQARLGTRLVYTDSQGENTAYGVVNLHQRWANSNSINVGNTYWSETFTRRWTDVGLGLNWKLPVGSLYGEAHYEHGLDGASLTGWRGHFGWRFTY